MTASFPETKTGPRFGLASAALAGCVAMVLLTGLPVRAEDANPVLAKVNGAEIRQSRSRGWCGDVGGAVDDLETGEYVRHGNELVSLF